MTWSKFPAEIQQQSFARRQSLVHVFRERRSWQAECECAAGRERMKSECDCAAQQVAAISFNQRKAPLRCFVSNHSQCCARRSVAINWIHQCTLLAKCIEHELCPGRELVVATRNEPERA